MEEQQPQAQDSAIPKITPETQVKKRPSLEFLKRKKFLWGVGAFFLFFLLALVIPGMIILIQARQTIKSAKALQTSVASQDLNQVKASLDTLEKDTKGLSSTYRFFFWIKPIPGIGGYVKDGDAALKAGLYGLSGLKTTINTLEPYADLVGFKNGHEAKSGEETANDRIEFVIEGLEEITPHLDQIAADAQAAQNEINKINPRRYPKKLFGREIRPQIERAVNLGQEASFFVVQSKPLIEVAPYLLGVDEKRTYLLLFQNDKELRPTGGFITAYAIMNVNKGKTESVSSNDIYNLDARYTPNVPAPEPIVEFIKGPYTLSPNLRLRDMNFDPDFKKSMELFTKEAQEAGIEDIDGVIAVDTQVVVNLLEVIGEIGVPGYGNFSTKIVPECDCPQVIYELESFADVEGPVVWDPLDPTRIIYAPANYDNRKEIVGPLMNSILSNTLGQPKEKLPNLFEAAFKSLRQKHILLYMFNDQAQLGVESFGVAGRITPHEGDYLHINDANLGGRKSNLYVTQEVHQEVNVGRDGTVEKTLEITYKNPQSFDGWLNSVLPNWTRVYVPEGSELVDSSGFDKPTEIYQEKGKTVFAGGFELRPQGVKKITLRYKLPFKVEREYNILVQKQPGTDMPLFTFEVGRTSEELFLRTDKEFNFSL